MKTLTLELRTPTELLLSQPVLSVQAEDESGWFGIYPGRRDLIAALVPGLLLCRDEAGETFVALDGGLLRLSANVCRVTSRDAIMARELDGIADALRAHAERRRVHHRRHRDVLDDLVQEALTRLVREAR